MFNLPSEFSLDIAERRVFIEDFSDHFYHLQLPNWLQRLEANSQDIGTHHPHEDHALISLIVSKSIERQQFQGAENNIVDELFLFSGIHNVNFQQLFRGV